MKITNIILVPFAVALIAVGAPGCADNGSSDDDVSTGSAAMSETASTELASTSAGWQKLGERTVDGHFDRDVITVGQDDGRFDSIQVRVDDSSLVLFEIKVIFGNGETFEPNVRLVFDEHTRSRAIDLPGNTRFIRRVEFKYSNIPGGGRARLSLFGKNRNAPSAWENLGARRVDGHFDHDAIVVGGEGAFSAIQVRVEQSALIMYDIRVTFENDGVFEPNVRLVFDENTRSRVIDLPGAARRHIERVDFKYGNVPGDGDATVQLWAVR